MPELMAARTFAEQQTHFKRLIKIGQIKEDELNVLKSIVDNHNRLPEDFKTKREKLDERMESYRRLEALDLVSGVGGEIPHYWFDVVTEHFYPGAVAPPMTTETAERLHFLRMQEQTGVLGEQHKALLRATLQRGNRPLGAVTEVTDFIDKAWETLPSKIKKDLGTEVEKLTKNGENERIARRKLLVNSLNEVSGLGITDENRKHIKDQWLIPVSHWLGP